MTTPKRHSIKFIIVLLLGLTIVLTMPGCSSSFSESKIKELYDHPEDFKGKTVKNLTMQIVAIDNVKGEVHLQAFENFVKAEHPTVVVLGDDKVKYEEGEYIKVSGKILGKVAVVDEEGVEMDAMKLKAKKIKKIKSTDAIPAEDTLDIGYDVKEKGVSASIEKIDFTSDDTRVYIKVKNGTKKTIEIFPEQSLIVQDGNDYMSDAENFIYEDVHLEKRVKAGETTSGVIIFKRIDQNLPFTFTLEGGDSNGNEFKLPFVFEMQ
ncbi:hypothetical protein [Mogibacterium pumilum]|uniref:DUF4352 domain-containing protein n=1 Tax=Mogibacterium pumilum TaxID=86332 RepID=A0A223AT97_9FIRM|nr:hypothetical protein [Mogibacterium pumilum]ASS38190.1 hypothetical protein AXF17_07100 [Mogibacterium pumilum]